MSESLRKIIHVDMDAFYASVEQLDNPSLRGKPIAVGGGADRGVVAAASYEARVFGVRSAMPSKKAKILCEDLIFVKPRFDRYKEISQKIRAVFFEYTDLVEPLSLDEAYLDVTSNKKGHQSATLLATEIRERIHSETGLNASAGISINKFIAKIASDINKPKGQKTVEPHEVLDFISKLEIRKFYGVGEKTTQKMYQLGIFTGRDLREKSMEYLETHFKKNAEYYYNISRGIHNSEVIPERKRKSMAVETTFQTNLSSEILLEEPLKRISATLYSRIEAAKIKGRTLTLKLKYRDFTQATRSKTVDYYIYTEQEIFALARDLLFQEKIQDSVRLIGLSLTNLNNEKTDKGPVQLTLRF